MTEAIAEATGRGETLKFTHVGIAIIGGPTPSWKPLPTEEYA